MRRNTFLGYFIAEVIVILLVMVIFKVIPDRQIAATMAGVLFVGLPVGMMAVEYRCRGLQQMSWFVAVLQFWTVFAIPILGLRLMNWGIPFENLSFLGISGPALHQWSSKSYTVMMLWTLWGHWKTRQKRKKPA